MIIILQSKPFAIAYGILQNREEAEDVVQDPRQGVEVALACSRPRKFPCVDLDHAPPRA
jgi:hypothetical protein